MVICAIISGLMLMVGVYRIHTFFKEEDAGERVNLPMLIRHASAFGLFLLSTTMWAIAITIWNLSLKTNEPKDAFYEIVATFDFVAQSILQLLLVNIFWSWGDRDAQDPTQRGRTFNTIVVDDDFDADTDLQCIVWNTLLNRRLASIEEG